MSVDFSLVFDPDNLKYTIPTFVLTTIWWIFIFILLTIDYGGQEELNPEGLPWGRKVDSPKKPERDKRGRFKKKKAS